MKTIIVIFIILHGLVHLLYFGQSLRYFELQSGMVWPDSSWLFSRCLSVSAVRMLAGGLCILIAVGFIISGLGLLLNSGWWRLLLVISAALSILIFVLSWDGHWRNLDDQGIYSILINVAILAGSEIFI